MKKIILCILASCYLFGCYTDKKATKQVTKAILQKPVIAAELTRKAFPCITTGEVKTVDSVDYNIWKLKLDSVNAFYEELMRSIEPEIIHDTVKTDPVVSKYCEEYKKNETIYRKNETSFKEKIKNQENQISDLNEKLKTIPPVKEGTTIRIKDSAEIFLIQNKLNELDDKNKKLESSIKTWKRVSISLFILFLLSMILHVLRTKFKLF